MPALPVVFTPRAARQIEAASAWWRRNRAATPHALQEDLAAALSLIVASPSEQHGLPAAELSEVLRRGKAALHREHARLPLPEKVRLVMELQRIVLPLIARQRALRSWERPWEIEP